MDNELLTWYVIVGSAARFLRAYDETNQLIINHTGETRTWAKQGLANLVTRANQQAEKITDMASRVPIARTAYCAERLTGVFGDQFFSAIDAGFSRIES